MTTKVDKKVDKVDKKIKFSLPHTWTLLFILIIFAAISTHFIPAGEYNRIEENNIIRVDPNSYHSVEANPAGILDVLTAFPKGAIAGSEIIFFIFIVSGAFYVVNQTKAFDAGIAKITKKNKGKEFLVVPAISFIFCLGGATFGMAEEVLPLIPLMIGLSIKIGYDSLIAIGMILVATVVGYSAGFMNPFTVGLAQGIAELPTFSAMWYRIIIFVVTISITIAYFMVYGKKVNKNRETSLVYEIDKYRLDLKAEVVEMTKKHVYILLVVALAFAFIVYGVTQLGWFITEISGVFLGMGIISGWIAGLKTDEIPEMFIKGMADMTFGAMIVGLARGVLIILDDAHVIDTIIFNSANLISGLPSSLTALGMYIVQIFISFIISSGTGMASLMMPILAPLSDIVGVTRQTSVLAFQLADGYTNVITPVSGYFIAALAMAGIPYEKWLKWAGPLILILWIVGGIFIVIADVIQIGPY